MKDGLGQVQSVLLLGGTSEIGQAIVRRLAITRRPARVRARGADPVRPVAAFAAEFTSTPGSTVEVVPFDAARHDSRTPA